MNKIDEISVRTELTFYSGEKIVYIKKQIIQICAMKKIKPSK